MRKCVEMMADIPVKSPHEATQTGLEECVPHVTPDDKIHHPQCSWRGPDAREWRIWCLTDG